MCFALALLAPAAAQTLHQEACTSPDGNQLTAFVPTADSGTPDDPPPPPRIQRDAIWQQMTCPANVYIKAVAMASPQVGYAAAELGIVLKTTDGGSTWQSVLNQGFPYYYYGVHAFDEQTVIITGFQNQTGEGILRWTDDGGVTWGSIVSLPAPTYFDWLYCVEFADADRGVIQGWGGGIWYTTNGGRTAADWTFVAPTNNWWAGTFTFLPDGRVWMTGYDNFRSTDGGANWAPIADADPLFDGPNGMLASGKGLIGGGTISPTVSGWIYSTTDGGDSWSPAPVSTPPYPVRALFWLGEDRAWAACGNYYSSVGGIWGSTDGGATWALEQNTGAEMLDITSVQVSPTEYRVIAVGQVSQIWRTTVTVAVPGDMDCDGVVNNADIPAFVLALTDPDGYTSQYPGCDLMLGDVDGDGEFNNADIPAFVELLTGG